jgi:hypothetical protein
MSAKSTFAAVIVTVLGFGTAWGQTPSPYGAAPPPMPVPSGPVSQDTTTTDPGPSGLSPYITYQRPDCCGPVGAQGPVQIDLYAGSGMSFPVGSNIMSRVLDPGWVVEAGARSLFFDPSMSAAWVIDLGLINIWNHANRPDVKIPLQLAGSATALPGSAAAVAANPGVTISTLDRTFVSLGLGRDWFLAGSGGAAWRIGAEGGFRYGSERLELNEITHRTDTIAAAFAGIYAGVEIPWGASVLVAAARVEWAYTWSDILQVGIRSDVSEVNATLQAGVRF